MLWNDDVDNGLLMRSDIVCVIGKVFFGMKSMFEFFYKGRFLSCFRTTITTDKLTVMTVKIMKLTMIIKIIMLVMTMTLIKMTMMVMKIKMLITTSTTVKMTIVT